MNRHTNLLSQLLIAVLVWSLVNAGAEEPLKRKNVLFIAIDDLRPELGCYGVEGIHSPHIDALADSGVIFDQAYCQLAVCNPSRVSLLTGLRPDSAKVWTLDVRFRETIPDAVTLPQHFKNKGFKTLGFGKIFHNPWPDNISWSEPHSWPKNSRLWSERAKKELQAFKQQMKAEGKPQRSIDRLRAVATERVALDDSQHIDGAIADQAIEALREAARSEEPFFIAAGFVRPHLPFVVPEKYWDLYDPDEIPLAENAALPTEAPEFAMNTMYELRDYMDFLGTPGPRNGTLTKAQQRELKHGYWASVSFIDAQVGRILEELEKHQLTEDTIVVLWSDHGWKLGEHNSWCKQTNYEIDARVPLIIRNPGAEGNGRRSASLVELVDIFPTLCDLADLEIPEHLEGVTLSPILEEPVRQVKEVAVSQFLRKTDEGEFMGYSMRTPSWRYVEWIKRESNTVVARELYDHREGNPEAHNLATVRENWPLITQFSEKLWKTIPKPAPAKAVQRRPTVVFRNSGSEVVPIYWVPAEGNPRLSRKLEAGQSYRVNTTKGHRFRIEEAGEIRHFTVTKQNEDVEVGIASVPKVSKGAPNIVVIMGDDWSWPHASVLGDPVVKTPHFDRIAREGVLFENACTPAPSCTPSRHAVVSGQYHWCAGVGEDLGSSIHAETPVYPDLLAAAGYETGFCRKGVGPSKHSFRGNDPLGRRFANFDDFMDRKEEGQPFCFWYGAGEPHRPYELGAGSRRGLNLDEIAVPPFLPDNTTVRSDLGDYYLRVQKLDSLAGQILNRLEKEGELENTIVVMTGDNGMPFPRAKATLYDAGTRVPMAIRWGSRFAKTTTVSDFVSLTDLAPTFLEAVGLPIPNTMTGHSLLSILTKGEASKRDFILTGMERHVYPNPSRAIRTKQYLYIRNFDPSGWPTGRVVGDQPTFDFAKTPWPTVAGAFSHNIDPGPTKQWMLQNENDRNRYSFGARPAEELYDLEKDPHQLTNLLLDRDVEENVAKARRTLSDRLTRELRDSGDQRFAKSEHATFEMLGWTIHLHDKLWAENGPSTRRALELMHGQLQRVVDVVPQRVLADLRNVPIWMNPPYGEKRGRAEYHGGAKWLKDNGRNPAMAKCVEVTNVKIFPFENRRMPFLMLHELAHAYHDQIVEGGFRNPVLQAAYERARDSGSYDEVARFDGNRTVKDKAYGMNNPMEYFAESTESYFGKNDFFPFNRDELLAHDPEMHQLVEEFWGVRE